MAGSSNTSQLYQTLNGMSPFQPISAPAAGSLFKADPYQAKDVSTQALPQYDAMRTRLDSQYSQIQGQAQDSLNRQFAAMGGGPGNGAQAKQTENLAASLAAQKSQDIQGINAQEAGTRFQLQTQEGERAFQSGETQKGYGFQAGMTAAQMGMGAKQFNAQMGLAQNQFMFDANSKIAGLDLQYQQLSQQGQQMKNEQFAAAFNAAMERKKNGDPSSIDYLINNFLQTGKEGGYI